MKVVCFDLDDTLYKEIDYLQEGYRLIAKRFWKDEWQEWYQKMIQWYASGLNVFEKICSLKSDVEMGNFLNMYRYDVHQLSLDIDAEQVLATLKKSGNKLGLISDGRELTQKNKIFALGLDKYVPDDMIILSERFGSAKPCEANYRYFMKKYPYCSDFTYVGDNPEKDFFAPNALGWKTVCLLDDGRNIHKQNFSLPEEYLPDKIIQNFHELIDCRDKRW